MTKWYVTKSSKPEAFSQYPFSDVTVKEMDDSVDSTPSDPSFPTKNSWLKKLQIQYYSHLKLWLNALLLSLLKLMAAIVPTKTSLNVKRASRKVMFSLNTLCKSQHIV